MYCAVTSLPEMDWACTTPTSRSASIASSNRLAGMRRTSVPRRCPRICEESTNPPLFCAMRVTAANPAEKPSFVELDRHRTVADDLREVAWSAATGARRGAWGTGQPVLRPCARCAGGAAEVAERRCDSRRRRRSGGRLLIRRAPESSVRGEQPMRPATTRNPITDGGDRCPNRSPSDRRRRDRRRGLASTARAVAACSQVGFEELQVPDVRVHGVSTSAAGCSPRSCSTIATRRRPRLTRWRALASVHASVARPPGTPGRR